MKSKNLKMIGKTYMHNSHQVTISDIQEISGDRMIVSTMEGKEFTVDQDELDNDFLPVESSVPAQTQNKLLELVTSESNQMNELSKILMENITKVQSDSKYIDQARAINENAKSLIDIKKAQIEMFKLLKS